MCETMTDKLGFEIETCSRCGGSGQYSYCTMYGSRCFKCAGKRVVLTKRGSAAKVFFDALFVVPASTIKVGDVIFSGGLNNKKRRVLAVVPECYGCCSIVDGVKIPSTKIEMEGLTFYAHSDTLVTKCEPKALYEERLAKALEYQASLTKAGKPRKTKVAK